LRRSTEQCVARYAAVLFAASIACWPVIDAGAARSSVRNGESIDKHVLPRVCDR
jgi:hypothetical protein